MRFINKEMKSGASQNKIPKRTDEIYKEIGGGQLHQSYNLYYKDSLISILIMVSFCSIESSTFILFSSLGSIAPKTV